MAVDGKQPGGGGGGRGVGGGVPHTHLEPWHSQ